MDQRSSSCDTKPEQTSLINFGQTMITKVKVIKLAYSLKSLVPYIQHKISIFQLGLGNREHFSFIPVFRLESLKFQGNTKQMWL